MADLTVNRIYIIRYQLRSANCPHCYSGTLLDVMGYQLPNFLPFLATILGHYRYCNIVKSQKYCPVLLL